MNIHADSCCLIWLAAGIPWWQIECRTNAPTSFHTEYFLEYHGWSILSDDWRGMRKAGAD